MAERKYKGTDAELLRMKREGLSLRAIAAEAGIGKSVAGTRIARAEAAEREAASMSARSSSSAVSSTSSADPQASGPVNVRAELEAIVHDPKAGHRERLGALQTLAKLGEAAGRPQSEEIRPRGIGTLAAEPHRHEDGTVTYRLWMRERRGWTSDLDGLTPGQTWAMLGGCLLHDELGEDLLRELRTGLAADEPQDGDR